MFKNRKLELRLVKEKPNEEIIESTLDESKLAHIVRETAGILIVGTVLTIIVGFAAATLSEIAVNNFTK